MASSSFISGLAAALLLATISEAREQLVPAMFIFGDSLLDVGTNNYLFNTSIRSDFPPNGETHFHRPTGRFSDGLITSDFLASFLGLPLPPPYIQPDANLSHGANFASAGAGLLDLFDSDQWMITFNHQVQQFQELVSSWDKDKLAKSILHIGIGNNDITTGYLKNTTAQSAYTPHAYIEFLMELYSKGIHTLYEAGARKLVISELIPVGCIPRSRLYARLWNQTGCLEIGNQLAQGFNAQLDKVIKESSEVLPGIKISYFRAYDFYMDMINNGTKYGFTETAKACCGSGEYAIQRCGCAARGCDLPVPPNVSLKPFLCRAPSKYLWWDIHPTQQAYRFISNAIWNGNTSLVFPFNLQTLATL